MPVFEVIEILPEDIARKRLPWYDADYLICIVEPAIPAVPVPGPLGHRDALAIDDEGSNTHLTNILHKAAESKLPQSSRALEKAEKITLSTVKFDSLPLAAVITMLHAESVKRDAAREGVTMSIAPDAKQLADAEINLELRDVTLAETLERVADSVGLEMQATDTELLLVRTKAKQ